MELLAVTLLVVGLLIGFVVGRGRRGQPTSTKQSPSPTAGEYRRGSSPRYSSREREYGGFGALGAQHESNDSGF